MIISKHFLFLCIDFTLFCRNYNRCYANDCQDHCWNSYQSRNFITVQLEYRMSRRFFKFHFLFFLKSKCIPFFLLPIKVFISNFFKVDFSRIFYPSIVYFSTFVYLKLFTKKNFSTNIWIYGFFLLKKKFSWMLYSINESR